MNYQLMKNYLILSVLILLGVIAEGQNSSKCSIEDLNRWTGHWQGSLTYIDYTSGKPYTMPANVDIYRIEETNGFRFSNIYPKEPKANSDDTLSLSMDGRYINGALVTSRKELGDGGLEVITEKAGIDGNDKKKAIIRHTYLIGKTTFNILKEVKYEGDKNWLRRSEYFYKR